MKKTFEFDVEESKTFFDILVMALDDQDAQPIEKKLIETIDVMRDFKITITVEEV